MTQPHPPTGSIPTTKKLVDAVVTAPIAKESWKLAGYNFPGHTELFAQRTGSRRFTMMFAGGPLKVALATVHVPLMDAPKFARNIEAAYRQMWRTWCETASTAS